MSDEAETARNKLRQKAEKIEHRARQQATYAEVALKRAKKDDPRQKQIKESREALISVGEQIDTVKAKIVAEREPLRESLAQIQQAVVETESEVERLRYQIETKEREIDKLSKMKSRKDAGLGDIIVLDPETKARANALRVEVAGLYTALGTAKTAQADAVQARDELETEAVLPVEADPRMAELYRNMEAETTALSILQSQGMGSIVTPSAEVFTIEDVNTMTELAVKKIKTSLPDFVEAPVIRDAIQKIEVALNNYIPIEVLALMRDSRGISGSSKSLTTRLIATLDSEVDVPMLDERQKNALLRIIVPIVVESMEDENTLDSVLFNATKMPSGRTAASTKKKTRKKPTRRSKKKVSKKARTNRKP